MDALLSFAGPPYFTHVGLGSLGYLERKRGCTELPSESSGGIYGRLQELEKEVRKDVERIFPELEYSLPASGHSPRASSNLASDFLQ